VVGLVGSVRQGQAGLVGRAIGQMIGEIRNPSTLPDSFQPPRSLYSGDE
jgi:hypothetical protein